MAIGQTSRMLQSFRLRMRAQRCQRNKNHAAAAALYRQAMELVDVNAFDLSMIAQCLENAGDDDAALRAAESALAIDPQAFLALQSGARIQARRGEYGAAKGYAERSLAVLPDESSWVFRGLGVLTKLLAAIPFLGSRVDRDELARFGHPDGYMHDWKKWVLEYLDWYRARVGQSNGASPH
jgi:tetratricopeptide (TPR) repeat protein